MVYFYQFLQRNKWVDFGVFNRCNWLCKRGTPWRAKLQRFFRPFLQWGIVMCVQTASVGNIGALTWIHARTSFFSLSLAFQTNLISKLSNYLTIFVILCNNGSTLIVISFYNSYFSQSFSWSARYIFDEYLK